MEETEVAHIAHFGQFQLQNLVPVLTQAPDLPARQAQTLDQFDVAKRFGG